MFDVRLENIRWLEKEIQRYEQQEILPGKILFYGDSSFTQWQPAYGHRAMEEDLRASDGSVAVVNHGFGTSTAEEQLYFYDRMVRPWQPRALVSVTRGNDWAAGYSAAEVLFLQSRLFEYARRDMPGIRIFACNSQPNIKSGEAGSNALSHEWEYNRLLADYCRRHDDCTLVDHWAEPTFFADPDRPHDHSNLRPELYQADKTHFNQEGYDLYAVFFRKVLKDLL